jgi:hypothetical protein
MRGSPDSFTMSGNYHARWYGSFAFHCHGSVFKDGPGAHPGSEYEREARDLR